MVALGKGDQGSVATLVADKKEAKWMKKHLESVVKKILDDVEVSWICGKSGAGQRCVMFS